MDKLSRLGNYRDQALVTAQAGNHRPDRERYAATAVAEF
jgi:hypothetical protein